LKYNILLVDDIKINLDILKEILSDYNLLCAVNGKDALDIVKNNNIDLILLDIMMPELDGYEVCNILQQNEKTENIPVIFVTSKTDEESIVKGYMMGARDYVTKPYKKLELLAKIKTHLKIKQLIEDLEYMAKHDKMTGLYNRGEFFRLAIQRFETKKENLYAVMIDIDKFKNINDTYGHHAGDVVIKTFAKIVKNYIDDNFILGRIGGEEFAIVCNFDNEKIIKRIIENIRLAIERENIKVDNQNIKFTISIGVTKSKPSHKSIDDLLKDADEMLYNAKNSGRNKVIFREREIKYNSKTPTSQKL